MDSALPTNVPENLPWEKEAQSLVRLWSEELTGKGSSFRQLFCRDDGDSCTEPTLPWDGHPAPGCRDCAAGTLCLLSAIPRPVTGLAADSQSTRQERDAREVPGGCHSWLCSWFTGSVLLCPCPALTWSVLLVSPTVPRERTGVAAVRLDATPGGFWALWEGRYWGSVWCICPCTEGEQLWPLQCPAEVGSA